MGNTHKKISPTNFENKKFVLGIIDPQNDFFKNGSLAVNNANEILSSINKLRFYVHSLMPTFITLDYHPTNHVSFASTHKVKEFTKDNINITMKDGSIVNVEQTFWPDHCIKNTFGSDIHSDLIKLNTDTIFYKGTNPNIESYSGFGDQFKNSIENTGLKKWLIRNDISDIILVGLATDYCVYFTALDAIMYGYKVHIILSCTRGVDEETTSKALVDLKSKGVICYTTVNDFINFLT